MGERWPIGRAKDGSYVHILNVVDEAGYSCPECSTPFAHHKTGHPAYGYFAHPKETQCVNQDPRRAITKHFIASVLENSPALPLSCVAHELPTKPYAVPTSDVTTKIAKNNYQCDVTCNILGKSLCCHIRNSEPLDPENVHTSVTNWVDLDIGDLSNKEIFLGDIVKHKLTIQLASKLPTLLAHDYAFTHVWQTTCRQCQADMRVVHPCEGEPTDSAKFYWAFGAKLLDTIRTLKMSAGRYVNFCPQCQTTLENPDLTNELVDKHDSGEIITTFLVN